MSSGGFAGRAAAIDHGGLGALHYLGNYVRRMPTNLPRMVENAYDWEHLPYVHPQAFSSIAIVEEGRWGWRAEVGLPETAGGGKQQIELLVDAPEAYWATTVVEGLGQGTQIHTRARDVSGDDGEEAIEVDVRFYLPKAPDTDEQAALILGYLQAQYAGLYDQDEALMVARQEALDAQRAHRDARGPIMFRWGRKRRWTGMRVTASPLAGTTIRSATTRGNGSPTRRCVRIFSARWPTRR